MANTVLDLSKLKITEHETFTFPHNAPLALALKFKHEKKWAQSNDGLMQGSTINGTLNFAVANLVELEQPIKVNKKTQLTLKANVEGGSENIHVMAAGLVPEKWFTGDGGTTGQDYKGYLLTNFLHNYLPWKDEAQRQQWAEKEWLPLPNSKQLLLWQTSDQFGYPVTYTEEELAAANKNVDHILPASYLAKKYGSNFEGQETTYSFLVGDALVPDSGGAVTGWPIDYTATHLVLYSANAQLGIEPPWKVKSTDVGHQPYQLMWTAAAVDTHTGDTLVDFPDELPQVGGVGGTDVKNAAIGSELYVPGRYFVFNGNAAVYHTLADNQKVSACDSVDFKLGVWADSLPKKVAIAFVDSSVKDPAGPVVEGDMLKVFPQAIKLLGTDDFGVALPGFDSMPYGSDTDDMKDYGTVSGPGNYNGGTHYSIKPDQLPSGQWDTIVLIVEGNTHQVFFRNLFIMNPTFA